tara:strand:- start:1668 stop:2018 length:351 start_codon:yes stop_codon:yes gene_type:complete
MLLPKNDFKLRRLKSKIKIDQLFENGGVFQTKSLLLRIITDKSSRFLEFGVSVSKKSFSRATERNRIKRQLRWAMTNQKGKLFFPGCCMLIYTGKTIPRSDSLFQDLEGILKNINH